MGIIHEKVRTNAMFCEFPNSALASLVEIIKKTQVPANERIVRAGDPGIAMYILVEGVARFDNGQMWMPEGAPITDRPTGRFQKLDIGQSFGEEIIFGLEEHYQYTIVTIIPCTFFSISEDGFRDRFRNMPDLHDSMYQNFLKSRNVTGIDGQPEDGPAMAGDINDGVSKSTDSKLRNMNLGSVSKPGWGQRQHPYQGHQGKSSAGQAAQGKLHD